MASAAFPSGSQASKVIELPLVLAIECGDAFVARCRMLGAQARSKFLVRACDLVSAKALGLQPVIIVVPRRLYDQKADELDALAARSDAAVLTC